MRLRILATTDLHMHVLPYDYFIDAPSDTRGLAKTASLIGQARAETPNCLLVDNGDVLTGTPMGDIALAPNAPTPHPMIQVMNKLGYDAATLGNHDFDHGLTTLESILSQADFPVVLANIDAPTPSVPGIQVFLPPFALLDRKLSDESGQVHQLRIGVFGLLPPHSIRPRRELPAPPTTRDMVDTARAMVPHLRAQGADIVLALAHTGLSGATHQRMMENALLPLSRVPGLDAIIGGHAHQVFPGKDAPEGADIDPGKGHVNGVPVAIPGFWGSHLGVIDLTLEPATGSAQRWRVASSQAQLRAIFDRDQTGALRSRAPASPMIAGLVAEAHNRTLAHVRTPVGTSAQHLHSYFSLLAPCAAVQMVQQVQRDFATRALRGTEYEGLPILSSASALKCGGIGGPDHYTDIPPGELTLRAVADLYLFPNDLVALQVDGAFLRAWLERSASVFNQLLPDRPDQRLTEPTTPCYLYETVLGLDYVLDLSQPARFAPQGAPINGMGAQSRLVSIRHQGRPLNDSDPFILVTNGFRTSGGGHFPGTQSAKQVLNTGDCIRDILRDHIRNGDIPTHAPIPHWRLQAAPGTSATFDCSPRALAHLAALRDLTLSPLARGTDGFQRFRIRF